MLSAVFFIASMIFFCLGFHITGYVLLIAAWLVVEIYATMLMKRVQQYIEDTK